MNLHHTSLMLPCRTLEQLPTHVPAEAAAEMLTAWTSLWHPELLAHTGRLPGWHDARSAPGPECLEGQLIVIPSIVRKLLDDRWYEQLRFGRSNSPPPWEQITDRPRTAAGLLKVLGLEEHAPAELVGDFFALGYAYLQVDQLTRAMSYATVLDTARFEATVVAAACAAKLGDETAARDGIAAAVDMLADARQHFYPVDFYLVDVTLVAPATLGEALRAELAGGRVSNLILSGELLDRMANEFPESLAALQQAVERGSACVLGGVYHDFLTVDRGSPEALLAALQQGRQTQERHLGRAPQVFAAYSLPASPLLPELLSGLGFRGALCVSFDGGRMPVAEQCKTRWGVSGGAWIDALTTVPLDAGRADTWLALGARIGDSMARDHVATVLVAGWPGHRSEFAADLDRLARYGPVLGRYITLDEYFEVTRASDDWPTYVRTRHPPCISAGQSTEEISRRVAEYRADVRSVYGRLVDGLRSVLPDVGSADEAPQSETLLNAWSFSRPMYQGIELTELHEPAEQHPVYAPQVPGCGCALGESPAALRWAEGRRLCNELIELVVSERTGGIQSLRAHRDRGTRISQRLVYSDREDAAEDRASQMLADRVAIVHEDGVLRRIASTGGLLDRDGMELARFTQTMTVPRGLPVVIVDVQLDVDPRATSKRPSASIASRLAWREEDAELRHGVNWQARPVVRQEIASNEWVEIGESTGRSTCFPLGLPLHRRCGPNRLDTLLSVGSGGAHRQFALGLNVEYPAQMALGLLTAGGPSGTKSLGWHPAPRGWFLHVDRKNVLVTHLEAMQGGSGMRLRVLETEGRDASVRLAAYRPFRASRLTDFCGEPIEPLTVDEGRLRFDIGGHRWLQLEAEW